MDKGHDPDEVVSKDPFELDKNIYPPPTPQDGSLRPFIENGKDIELFNIALSPEQVCVSNRCDM